MGQQVTRMVQDCFRTGEGIEGINGTNLVLIPKINSPKFINHYRPINLCNLKIMTNRMKGCCQGLYMKTKEPLYMGDLYKIIS